MPRLVPPREPRQAATHANGDQAPGVHPARAERIPRSEQGDPEGAPPPCRRPRSSWPSTAASRRTQRRRRRRAALLTDYAAFARNLGCRVEDVSYDLERIAFYGKCDLHVGYRLHGHLEFLSQRLPSVLLEEDGRGRGATEALGAPGVRGWELTWSSRLARVTSSARVARVLARRFAVKSARPAAVPEALATVRDEIETGFRRCAAVPARIDATWPIMEEFVRDI